MLDPKHPIYKLGYEIQLLLKKEQTFMQMEVRGLLNKSLKDEYQNLIDRLEWLENEKTTRLLQETNDLAQHQQSKELLGYIQSASPLIKFDENIFKRIISKVIVVTQEKVRFELSNEQQIELEYKTGKFKNDDII